MYYIVLAWLPALIGVLPLLLRQKMYPAITMFVISGIVLNLFAWFWQPSLVWPLWGFAGLMTFVLWCVAAVVDVDTRGSSSLSVLFPVVGVLLVMGSFVLSSDFVNTTEYAQLIQPMETREWTQDIQPKDPHHMATVTPENALYIAQKAMGQEGAIGSQFHIAESEITLQRVHDELVYVVPLDFAGFSTWTTSSGVPAYIVVYAEDHERKPVMVKLATGQQMTYTPGAYFGHELERRLRQQGYYDVAFAAPRFELDEDGHAWWITTTMRPTIGWGGERATGVLITNPADGATTFYPLEKVPEWVDRVIPSKLVSYYITKWGNLSGGWRNSWYDGLNLMKPEKTTLIYGANNRAVWVTDVTSDSTKDDSLLGLVYTDSRTGKSIFYTVAGGGTAKAILAAVNMNQEVQYKHLHGDYVQTYNIEGTMGAVVPVLNGNNAYQGVAIVELKNPQDVAYGTTQYEALSKYKAMLARRGQQVSVEGVVETKTLHGVIDRIHQDAGGTESGLYYFNVVGVRRIFTASSKDYPKLPLAKPGDTVDVKYLASSESVLAVAGFDDVSIAVDVSKDEARVTEASAARQEREINRDTGADAMAKFKNLKPEEQQKVLKSITSGK